MVLRAGTFTSLRQSSEEALPDLARAPVRFLALGRHDGRFDLLGQLVGVSMRAPGTIREPLQPAFLIALEDLVAGFSGDPETPGTKRPCSRRPSAESQIVCVRP